VEVPVEAPVVAPVVAPGVVAPGEKLIPGGFSVSPFAGVEVMSMKIYYGQ